MHAQASLLGSLLRILELRSKINVICDYLRREQKRSLKISEQQEGEFQKTEASKRGIGDIIAMARS